MIEHRYHIPFIRLPDPVCYRNTKSAFEHSNFVDEAIHELMSTRCVEQCSECPVCSPLSVVVNHKGKKFRLVLNVRYVNQFIQIKKNSFKYEGLIMVPQLFFKGDTFHHVRLKVGLPHMDTHVDYWPFLGFSWGIALNQKWYVFKILPFGGGGVKH